MFFHVVKYLGTLQLLLISAVVSGIVGVLCGVWAVVTLIAQGGFVALPLGAMLLSFTTAISLFLTAAYLLSRNRK